MAPKAKTPKKEVSHNEQVWQTALREFKKKDGRLEKMDRRDDYLDPTYDPNKLFIRELRYIFHKYHIDQHPKTNARKDLLVDIFNENKHKFQIRPEANVDDETPSKTDSDDFESDIESTSEVNSRNGSHADNVDDETPYKTDSDDFESEIESTSEVNSRNGSHADNATSQADTMEPSVVALTLQLEELEVEKQHAQSEVARLQTVESGSDDSIKRLQREVRDLETAQLASALEQKKKDAANADLQGQVASAESRAKTAEMEAEELRKQYASRDSDIDIEKELVESLTVRELQAQVKELQKAQERHNKALAEKDKTIAELRKEQEEDEEALTEKDESIAVLNEKVASKTSDLEKMKKATAKLTTKIALLNGEVASKTSDLKEIERSAKIALEERDKSIADLKEKFEKYTQHADAALDQKRSDYTAALKQTIEKTKQDVEEVVKKKDQQINELKDNLERVKESEQELQEELEELKEDKTALEDTFNELSEQMADRRS